MKSKIDGKKGDSKIKMMNVKRKMVMDKNKSKSSSSRSILCLQNKSKLEETEKEEDCFVLDYVPDDSLHKISVSKNNNEVSVVAEKGQVACRDFPHSRHTCAKYPFSKTNHERYCQLCYCFVCDRVAPCIMWTGSRGHCHAVNNETWKLQRKDTQLRRKVKQVILRTSKAMEEAVTALEKQSLMSLRKTMPEFREASRELHNTFDEFCGFLKR